MSRSPFAGEPQSISLEELKQLPHPQLTQLWKEYVDELRAALGRAAGDEASPAGRRVVALVEELRMVLTCLIAASPLGMQSLRQDPRYIMPLLSSALPRAHLSNHNRDTRGGTMTGGDAHVAHLPHGCQLGMQSLRQPPVALCVLVSPCPAEPALRRWGGACGKACVALIQVPCMVLIYLAGCPVTGQSLSLMPICSLPGQL